MQEISVKFEPYMEFGKSDALNEAIDKWLSLGNTLPTSSGGVWGKSIYGGHIGHFFENKPQIVRGGRGVKGEYDEFFLAICSGSFGPHKPGLTSVEVLAKLKNSDEAHDPNQPTHPD